MKHKIIESNIIYYPCSDPEVCLVGIDINHSFTFDPKDFNLNTKFYVEVKRPEIITDSLNLWIKQQQEKEDKEHQKRLDAAKKLLEESGFEVKSKRAESP